MNNYLFILWLACPIAMLIQWVMIFQLKLEVKFYRAMMEQKDKE